MYPQGYVKEKEVKDNKKTINQFIPGNSIV